KSEDEKPAQINVMVTQLVRKGVPRDKKFLPRQHVQPPPPQVKPQGPKITQEVTAPPAKPKEKKPKPEKADDEKLLKQLQDKLRKQQKDDRVPTNEPPEGQLNGSEQGTATTASQGDPCATAIVNGVKENWTVPEVLSERQMRSLVARVRARLNKNG